MKASVEISLYPLSDDYKDRIHKFILRMRKEKNLEFATNGMSTQIFGDYDVIMTLLTRELKEELSSHRTMAILKIGDGEMKADKLPADLK